MLPEKKKIASVILAKMDGDGIKEAPEGGDVLDIIADDVISAVKSGSKGELKAALRDFVTEIWMELEAEEE